MEAHGVHAINVDVAQMDYADGRTATRLEHLRVRGRGLGEGHCERVHRVCDTHPEQRVAEFLRRLPRGVDLAEVVRQNGAFTLDEPGADIWVRGL